MTDFILQTIKTIIQNVLLDIVNLFNYVETKQRKRKKVNNNVY